MCDITNALKYEHYMNIYFNASLTCLIKVVLI